MIFVDTGAWFAMAVPLDQDHIAVAQCFSQNVARLIITFGNSAILSSRLSPMRARSPNFNYEHYLSRRRQRNRRKQRDCRNRLRAHPD